MPLNVLNDIDGLRVFITRRQNFKYSNEADIFVITQSKVKERKYFDALDISDIVSAYKYVQNTVYGSNEMINEQYYIFSKEKLSNEKCDSIIKYIRDNWLQEKIMVCTGFC